MNRIQKKLEHFMLLVVCVFIPLHAFTQNEDIMKKLDLSDEYYMTGFGYFEQDDYAKALPYLKKSYEIEIALPKDVQELGWLEVSISFISNCYLHLGKLDDAIDYALKALAYYKEMKGEESTWYVDELSYLASCYYLNNQLLQAVETQRISVQLSEIVYGKESEKYILNLKNYNRLKSKLKE